MSTIERRMPGSRQVNQLPQLVRLYLERATRADIPAQVEIHQTGEMFRRPGSRTMRFTAIERFATDRIAFVWSARFAVGPGARFAAGCFAPLQVTDRYEDGRGTLSVRAFGVPLQRQSGHEVAVGEAYRYLAELPWVPHAMAANPQLKWRELDESAVEVSTEVAGERVAVTLAFDRDGEIARTHATARPRSTDGGMIECAWGGDFRNYGWRGSIRMPTEAEVYWEDLERKFVYWRARVDQARVRHERLEG
jgi:hypothetical protein